MDASGHKSIPDFPYSYVIGLKLPFEAFDKELHPVSPEVPPHHLPEIIDYQGIESESIQACP